jgi:hypothetical protein
MGVGHAAAVATVVFAGTGKWNGKKGYTFEATGSRRRAGRAPSGRPIGLGGRHIELTYHRGGTA